MSICRSAQTTVLLAITLVFASATSAQTLRLVTEEWPGLVDQTIEGPEGILWEISEQTLNRMGYSVTLEFMPWKRALKLVQQGARDGIVGIGHTPARAKTYRFPDQPLLLSRTVVISSVESAFEFESLESLAGLAVGVSPGYSYSKEIREAAHFSKVDMPSIESGLGMLLLGRIDVMLANEHVVAEQAKNMGILDRVAFSETEVSGGPVYLAFRRGFDPSLVAEFSKGLKKGRVAAHKPVEQ